MALAFDAAANGNTTGTSLTFSHVCTGSNLILLVGADVASGSDVVTGITYNGVAMTRVDVKAENGGTRTTYLYYLLNPATGSNSVVISLSSSLQINGFSASYTGAQQSGQPDSHSATSEFTVTTSTNSTTVVAANCWIVAVGRFVSSGAIVAGGGTTLRTSIGSAGLGDSNGVVGTGSQTLLFTDSPASNTAFIIISIAPSAATSVGNNGYAFII